MTPSVVAFDEAGERVAVGEAADAMTHEAPSRVVRVFKKALQTPIKLAEEFKKLVSYAVVGDKDGYAAAKIGSKVHSFTAMTSEIINSLNQDALRELKKPEYDNLRGLPLKYVLGVPNRFNYLQRKATKDAAKMAGQNNYSLISESVAASVNEIPSSGLKSIMNMIVDIGGGTTDVTIQSHNNGIITTKGSAGNFRGGVDYDHTVAEWIGERQKKSGKKSPHSSAVTLKKAEELKITLSRQKTAEYDGEIYHRLQFEKRSKPHVDELIALVKQALKTADVEASKLDHILLVGGSASVPFIKPALQAEFKRDVILSNEPDFAVALGAAKIAAQNCNHDPMDVVLITKILHGYGVKSLHGQQLGITFIAEPNSAVPATFNKTFTTAQDLQTTVEVNMYQGLGRRVEDNQHVGTIVIDNIPPKPAGEVQIHVSFHITEEQLLTASVWTNQPGSVKKEKTLSVDDVRTDKEIEEKREKVKFQNERFEYIIEVENKLGEAHKAVNNPKIKPHLKDEYVNFFQELYSKWEAVKSQNEKSAKEMRELFDTNLNDEANVVLGKIIETKQEVLQKEKSKSATDTSSDYSSSSATSSAAPDDL